MYACVYVCLHCICVVLHRGIHFRSPLLPLAEHKSVSTVKNKVACEARTCNTVCVCACVCVCVCVCVQGCVYNFLYEYVLVCVSNSTCRALKKLFEGHVLVI